MEYIKSILGKNANELTYQDIEVFFTTPRIESNILEFKSFNPMGPIEQKMEGVYQTICSFLNSEGGLLIWGAPEGQKVPGKKEKEFVGQLTPLNQHFEKDTFINKISSSISPLPSGVTITPISSNNSHIYLFEVNKSESPHQTGNIYYIRIDGQKRPAPHYYLEALFRKITYPNLGGYLRFNNVSNDGKLYYLSTTIFIMNHSPFQNEEKVSFRLFAPNGKFHQGSVRNGAHLDTEGAQIYNDEFAKILHYGSSPFLDADIIYDHRHLSIVDYECHLILMFGGKNSPIKSSEYFLKFDHTENEDFKKRIDVNKLVYKIDENKLMSERGNIQLTETQKVNKILKR